MTLKADRDPLLTPWANRDINDTMTLPEAIEIVDKYRTACREEKPFIYKQETLDEAIDVILIAAKTYNKIVQITNVAYSITK